MKNVITQLNQIQSDAHAMFVKVHNYHWNVKGMQFYAIHNKTEEIYNDMATLYDDMAERAIQLGGQAVLSMSEIIKITRIEEEKENNFDAKSVVSSLIKDFEYLKGAFETLSHVAEEAGDKTTVAMADEKIARFEKELWMMKASLA